MGTLHSSIGSKRRTMIKIAILGCLAALATAEADADAFYGPYGYSQYSQGYTWPMNYGPNWPMYSGNMWSMHHGYSYGKRSADAEPTAEAEAVADAEAYYHPYGYGYSNGYDWNMNNNWNNNWNMNMNNNWNKNWHMNNMNNNWNMNYMNYLNSGNMWNRYGMQQRYGNYNYGKRSADAEPMMYGPWGYPRYMGYMNRPYHYYGYPAYHF